MRRVDGWGLAMNQHGRKAGKARGKILEEGVGPQPVGKEKEESTGNHPFYNRGKR